MTEPTTNGNGNGNGKRSTRDRWVDVGTIALTLTVLGWLITELAIPKVLATATETMREELKSGLGARKSQVDERFTLMSRQLDKLATAEGLNNLRDRLTAIEDRLRELERKMNGK